MEHVVLLEPGRGKEGSSLGGFKGAWPYQHLDFRILGSETIKKKIIMFQAIQFMALCYGGLRKLRTLYTTTLVL